MLRRFPSLPFCSVPVLVLRLSIFGVATVHPVFGPIFKSGLGCFSIIRFFPFARSWRCFEQAGVKFEGLISARVRRYFAAQPMPVAEVGEIASAFSLSVRTLTRKLEEEVRTFRAIRDDLRRDLTV